MASHRPSPFEAFDEHPNDDPADPDVRHGHRRALLLLASLGLVMALPFLLAPWPIAQDLPAHVETAWQMLAVWRGEAAALNTFVVHAPPWPNALPTFAMAGLLAVLPDGDGLLAGKIVTALGIAMWPVSLGLLFARLRRPALLAALAIPTCFDLSLTYGFVHFVVGKPLWVLALVAAIDVARRPSGWRLFRLALALFAVFSTHLMLFATAAPLAGLLIVLLGRGLKVRAMGLGAVVVGGAPSLLWASQHLNTEGGAPGGAVGYLPLGEMVTRLWTNLGDLAPGPWDGAPWIVCGLALVLLLVLGAATDRFFTIETVAATSLFVFVAAFALLGPVRTPQVSIVAERFTAVAAALLVAVVPVTLTAGRRRLIVLAAAVAVGVAGFSTGHRFWTFSTTEMSDFGGLAKAVPAGARVATLYGDPRSPSGRHNALWHWPKLLAARGATTDDSFAWRETCVVGLQPGQMPPRHPALTPVALANWDYLLAANINPTTVTRLKRLGLVEVYEAGSWRLYRNPNATPGR